jgi:hypothetical protein
MTNTTNIRSGAWRSRWAAMGAAVAVTLGAGGLVAVNAASSVPSSVVTIDPVRILDTRDPVNIGLPGPLVAPHSHKLQVTGPVETTTGTPPGTQTPVPLGATGVLLNVTVVRPSADGFLSVRPGDATGAPSTSSLNFTAGSNVSNSVQVGLPTAGENAGQIDITYDALGQTGPTTEVLVDVVGYLVDGGTGEDGSPGTPGEDGGQPVLSGGVGFIDPLDTDGFVSLGRTRMVAVDAATIGAVIPVAGTLSNFNVSLVHSSGDVIATVFVNGTATSTTCTVAAAASTCADAVNTVPLVSSDVIAVRIQNQGGAVITNFSWTGWLAP